MNAAREKDDKVKVPDRRTTGAPIRAVQRLMNRRLMDACRSPPRSVDVEPIKVTTKDILDEMLSGMDRKERVDRLNKILTSKDSSMDMRDEARKELSRMYIETAPNVIW